MSEFEIGWNAAIWAAHQELGALALRNGWNTDSDAYQCDLAIQELHINKQPTTRQIRQALYKLNTPEGEKLRRELYSVEDQDAPATLDSIKMAWALLSN